MDSNQSSCLNLDQLYLSPSPQNSHQKCISNSNRTKQLVSSISSKGSPFRNILESPFNRIDRWLDNQGVKWLEEGYDPNLKFQQNSAKRKVIKSILSLHSFRIQGTPSSNNSVNSNLQQQSINNTMSFNTGGSQQPSLLERRLMKMRRGNNAKNISNFESNTPTIISNNSSSWKQQSLLNNNNNQNKTYGISRFSPLKQQQVQKPLTNTLKINLNPQTLNVHKQVLDNKLQQNEEEIENEEDECKTPLFLNKKCKNRKTQKKQQQNLQDDVKTPKRVKKSRFSILLQE